MDDAIAADEQELRNQGWRPVRPSAFTQLIGPILFRHEGDGFRFCFRVQDKHDNSVERPHGGMIMAFCDEALGMTAHRARPGERLLTIGFECQFLDASSVGDLIVAETEVTRATASLMFMRGTCRVGDRAIASCSGIWKVVSPRPAIGPAGG